MGASKISRDPIEQIRQEVRDTDRARDTRRGSIQNVLRDLPEEAGDRKAIPIFTGVVDYFPLALAEVARVSQAGNDQHNPGQPLHWARGKSSDHADAGIRHTIQRGTRDKDGLRHSAKAAWRALALLQEECEAEAGFEPEAVSALRAVRLGPDCHHPEDCDYPEKGCCNPRVENTPGRATVRTTEAL